MRKIFITGGTDFVGAYLIAYLLKQGYSVRALRRAAGPMDCGHRFEHQVEWVEGDLFDLAFLEESLRDIQHVYHCEELLSFAPEEVERMFKINVQGTANMVNASLYVGVEKYLQVSSTVALGHRENGKITDEQLQWKNSRYHTSYAVSKFKAECEVWRAIQEGLNAVIVNPSMVVGAGCWNAGANNVFSRIEKEGRFYPRGRTGCIDVRDVAKLSIALMESEISAERFLLSAGNLSYRELFEIIARLLNRQPAKRALPSWLGNLWRALDWLRAQLTGQPRVLTKEILSNLQAQRSYSNEKIKKALEATFIPIRESLKETTLLYLKSKDLEQKFDWLELR